VILKSIEGGIFMASSNPCIETELASYKSPGNKYLLKYVLSQCGNKETRVKLALNRIDTQVYRNLLNTKAIVINSNGVVFKPLPIGIKWPYDDQLVVYLPKELNFRQSQTNYGGVWVKFKTIPLTRKLSSTEKNADWNHQ